MIMEIDDIRENKKWTTKVRLFVAGLVALITAGIKALSWKVVEATVFEEIAKVALVSLGFGVAVSLVLWVPITMIADARLYYKPKYGKSWFKQAWKEHSLFKK